MTRTLMLVALALVGGCDDSATSQVQDAAIADLAVRDFSIVNDPRCPPGPGWGSMWKPCPMAGIGCDYGLEDSLLCVGPEDRWVFCGGAYTTCESVTEGALCCGPRNAPCILATDNACVCINFHLHCGVDGGI